MLTYQAGQENDIQAYQTHPVSYLRECLSSLEGTLQSFHQHMPYWKTSRNQNKIFVTVSLHSLIGKIYSGNNNRNLWQCHCTVWEEKTYSWLHLKFQGPKFLVPFTISSFMYTFTGITIWSNTELFQVRATKQRFMYTLLHPYLVQYRTIPSKSKQRFMYTLNASLSGPIQNSK